MVAGRKKGSEMTQHITQEQAVELSIKSGDEFAIHEAEFYTNLCNAAIQHYIDQRAKDLPELPDHPEPRTMKWSALEIEAIQAYGLQCAAHARERALSDEHIEVACSAAASMGNKLGIKSTDALTIVAAYNEALKGK
jgi:hypothetical protein